MRRVLALTSLGAVVLAVVLFVIFSDDQSANLSDTAGGGTAAEAGLDEATGDGSGQLGDGEANSETELADANRTEIADADENAEVVDADTPASLHLRLVDSNGEPAVGSKVQLTYSGYRNVSGIEFAMMMDRVNQVESEEAIEIEADETGAIVLENLETSKNIALILSGPYWSQRQLQVAELDPGETRELGDQILAPGVLLSGRILGPDGKGIESAKIQLSDRNSKNEFGFGMGGRLPGEFRGETETDKDGNFTIEGVRLGSYTLDANATGFVLASTSVELNEGRIDHSVELHLAMGGHVTGVVRDADGKPLPSARVALVRSRGFSMYQWNHKRLMEDGLPVEQDGSFRLAGLPSEGKWRIVAAAEGFARGRSETVAPGAKMELLLDPRMSLGGTLHDSKGVAVEGAEIRLLPQSSDPNRDFFRRASAVTDEQGAFDLDDIKAGTFNLEVTSAAGVLSQENVEVGPESEPLELILPAADALVITVMNPNGEPLEGARVILRSNSSSVSRRAISSGSSGNMRIVSRGGDSQDLQTRERSTKSDEHGQVRIFGLSEGEWTLTANLDGYASLPETIQRKGEGQQFEKITLHPGAKIRLTAVDITGTPVAGARVNLTQDDETGFKAQSGSTDPWGLVVWSNLPPGAYRISESNDEEPGMLFFGPEIEETEEQEEGPASNDVICELKAGEFTEQQIVMAAKVVPTVFVTRMGSPVSSAHVVLVKDGPTNGFSNFRGVDESSPSGQTNAQGLATLPPCDAGEYTIEARATSASPATKLRVLLQPGQQQVVLELATGVITGTVVGSSGPLQGAQVRLNQVEDGKTSNASVSMAFVVSMGGDDDDSEVQTMDFSPGQTTATTDDKGQFRFQDVPAGNYEVRVVQTGYITLVQDAKQYDGAGQLDYGLLQMELGASLKGRVIGLASANDEPGTMSMELLEIRDEEDNRVQMAVLRKNGEFTFKDLKPGTYYLLLRSNGEEHRSDLINVNPGTPTQFTFTL